MPPEPRPVESHKLRGVQYARFCDALSAAAGADYEMATAADMLDVAGLPELAAEANALFEQVMAFREKLRTLQESA